MCTQKHICLKGKIMYENTEGTSLTLKLIDFIDRSPTVFHALENVSAILSAAGFTPLDPSKRFSLVPGEKYYVERGGSALIAFKIPHDISDPSFSIAAVHGDSPALKLKPSCETDAFGKYTRLSVEKYGGMILQSFFDRPLSIAGRISFFKDGCIQSKNVALDRDLLIIPSVPPHLGSIKEPSLSVDMLPLFSQNDSDITLSSLLAKASGICKEDIISSDLFVCNRQKGAIIGSDGEFFCAPRIDDLQCAYSILEGLIESSDSDAFSVFALYDNEETGSSSRQGAASSFLSDTLRRALLSLGKDEEDYLIALESSFMISADNAHAKHPNHPELFDQQNVPVLNGGIVIKTNASQKYTTDAVSASLTEMLCKRAEVPFQSYANRADLAGGSTLGNILVRQLPVCSADIGLSQLAMHSCLETAGTYDPLFMMKLSKLFFETKFSLSNGKSYKMSNN